jgi:hypothetical protein
MGPKKKVEHLVVSQTQLAQEEKANHNIIAVKLLDGIEAKISEDLLVKYSQKMRSMIDLSDKKGSVNLSEFDNETFDCLVEFLNLHKEKEPMKISTPIRTNQSLKAIMEEADASYIDKIVLKGDHFMLKMLQISTTLEIEQLRKRLACGIAIKIMQSTMEEHREKYYLK